MTSSPPTPHLERLISIDAEANGLGGQAFAVAMTLSDDTGERAHTVIRCPLLGPVDPWVARNVLPVITDIPVTVDSYDALVEMVADIHGRWMDLDTYTIAHVPWPVEARLLLDAFPGPAVWRGPYPLLDVASELHAHGHDPKSVDDYLRAHDVPLPDGNPHHPLYDARAAERCLRHLLTGQIR